MSIIQYLTSINMIFGSHYTVREISKYFRNAHNLSMKSFYKSSNIFAHSLCIVYIYTRICICLIQLYVYIHIYVCIRMIRVWLITFPFQGTDAVLIALGIINADVNYVRSICAESRVSTVAISASYLWLRCYYVINHH